MASASFYGYTPAVTGVSAGGNIVSPAVTTTTTRQFLSALATQEDVSKLFGAVNADVNSPEWISFWMANNVTVNDPIYSLTMTVYGYNEAAMTALLALAKTLDP